jgi:hypothetical protein
LRRFILKFLVAFGLAGVIAGGPAFAQQIPPEWQAAAQAVIGALERGTPLAAKPWSSSELTQGWQLARAWRRRNNGNIEITLAEYLTFTTLCRQGCAGNTIEGKPYATLADEVKELKVENGGPYALAAKAQAWLAALPDPTGAAAKNALLWAKDPEITSADFATANLYALDWLLARAQPTPAQQAATFARLAILVQGKGWLGNRCLDITKVATVLDAPPVIEDCK